MTRIEQPWAGCWLGLAVLACLLAPGLAASAEDMIVTKDKTYRGRVKSADVNGIVMEISVGGGQNTITVPHKLVVKASVAPPESVTQGIAAYEKGNYREAQTLLEKTYRQYAGLDVDWAAKSMLYYGKTHLVLGNLDQAQKAFALFTTSYPENVMLRSAQVGMADIEVAQKKYESALAKFRQLAEVYDKQLKPPKAELPIAAEIYIGMGQCLEGLAKPEDALNAYLTVVALYPAEQYYPEALFRSAMVFSKLKRAEQAQIRFEEIIRDYSSTQWGARAIEEQKKLAAMPKAEATTAASKVTAP